MYQLFLALFSIAGTFLLAVGTYLGLAMGGLVPLFFEPHGDWIIGILPVVFGALGMISLFFACDAGSKLVVRGWRDIDPEDRD